MTDVLDPIAAFTEEARRYCALIEDDSVVDPRVFAQRCLLQVVRLYERALLLPTVNSVTPGLLDPIEHDEWQKQMQAVQRRLSRDCYWEVFEPLAKDQPETTLGSLSDDLGDIWRDVKPGLLAIDGGGRHINDIVWQWRFDFEYHWCRHTSGAIVALQALYFGFSEDVADDHEGH